MCVCVLGDVQNVSVVFFLWPGGLSALQGSGAALNRYLLGVRIHAVGSGFASFNAYYSSMRRRNSLSPAGGGRIE